MKVLLCALFMLGGVHARSQSALPVKTVLTTSMGHLAPGEGAQFQVLFRAQPSVAALGRKSVEVEAKGSALDWEYGSLGADGKEVKEGYFQSLRSAFYLDCADVNLSSVALTNKSPYELKVTVLTWDENWNFLEALSLDELRKNRTSTARYIRFSLEFLAPDDLGNPVYVHRGMFDFNFRYLPGSSIGLRYSKHPKFADYIDIFYDFKRNLGGDVLSTSEANPVKYSTDKVFGNGYLLLPSSYAADGEPTRLIIFAHGSADTEPTPGKYRKYLDYLVHQGYAVADCHAWGRLGGPGNPYIGQQFWGTPTNYASYQAFYSYLIKKYNFHQEIFLFGKSQGGLQVFGIPYNTTIPVKAACALAGESSIVGNQHGYTTKDRFACYEDMGFTGLEKDPNGEYVGEAAVMKKRDDADYEWSEERLAYYRKNKEKWMYYNPAMSGIVDLPSKFDDLFPFVYGANGNRGDFMNEHPFMTAAKALRCPFICFVAKDDMYAASNRMKIQIEAGGGICVMRLMPSGNERPHSAVDLRAPMIPEVATRSGVVCTDVPVPYVEMLEFFQRYE